MEDAEVRTDLRDTWEEVYRSEGPPLWRSLLLFSGSREIASDAMAEAFAQAIARGDAVRSPGAWVWKAAFMLARRELGAERREVGREVEREVVSHDATLEEVLDLLIALRSLRQAERAALVLHHYAGYPLRDVAQILGTTRSTVGVLLFRARSKLRHELEGEGDA